MNKQSLLEENNLHPYSLETTQEWFSSVITAPLTKEDAIQPYSPDGYLICEEASRYIVPSPTLKPHQRIQIYNQQYWWRLLNTLHTNFPLVTRLFGRIAFNEEIAIPYLLRYPPDHWSLSGLGEKLPIWISNCYEKKDKNLVLHTTDLDWAFIQCFLSPESPKLDLSLLTKEKADKLLELPFYLQSHIHLFTWEYDLFTFREELLKQEADYWIDHPFPTLAKEKNYYFLLYRNYRNNPAWRTISQGEYLLLSCFKEGSSMNEACEFMENQDPPLHQEAVENLQKWIMEWTQMGWLSEQQPPKNF
jgi:hypothetical protein